MESEQDYMDIDPVDKSVLDPVEGFGSSRVVFEGEITHVDLYSKANNGRERKVVGEVEIEYLPLGGCNVSEENIQEYLDTFSMAVTTPERASRLIHEHLEDVLDLDEPDDLYVQIRYDNSRSTKMVTYGTII